MPVATQASLKGLTAEQLEETGCRLCLNNTYHLGLKPGQPVLDAIGGAHKLQGWNYNILTDSGGLVTALYMLLPHTRAHFRQISNGFIAQIGRGARGRGPFSQSSRWIANVCSYHPRII
jgi:tRNA-guanine family transglycosylase